MASVSWDLGSVSLWRQSNWKGKFKKTDGQKVALHVGIIKWIWIWYSSLYEVWAFDIEFEKVMAVGFYLIFICIRYIPTLEYFLVPKDDVI